MDFWNTRMGYELADALTRYLPSLAKRKNQTAIAVETDPIADDIMSAINDGKSTVPKAKKSVRDISLTKAQETAVFFRKGIARVNAGAGAGKTLVVALRTAYMLDEGISPEDILLVTFTDAGAKEMRERIEMYDEDLGTGTDMEALNCMTFNSFGNNIIKEEYKALGYSSVPRLIDNIERKDIITKLLNESVVPGLDYKNFLMDMPYVKGALTVCEEAFRIIKRDRLSSYEYDELCNSMDHI